MRIGLRHLGVFCVTIVVAYIVADFMPLSVDARDVYIYAVLLFFLYLGVSYIVESRRR